MLLYQPLLLLHFEKSITCPIDIKAYYNAVVINVAQRDKQAMAQSGRKFHCELFMSD